MGEGGGEGAAGRRMVLAGRESRFLLALPTALSLSLMNMYLFCCYDKLFFIFIFLCM